MTALPDWMVHGLTVDDYEALPEEVARQIEIVDGRIVLSPSPLRPHQRVGRRLANSLDEKGHPALRAELDVDLRLRDVPLLMRRPDVVVYDASLPDDAVLRPEHCRLVVEVMSPGSITTDRADKPAEYSIAGIGHFWRIELLDQEITLFRYRLEKAGKPYELVGKDSGIVSVTEPVALTVDLDSLLR